MTTSPKRTDSAPGECHRPASPKDLAFCVAVAISNCVGYLLATVSCITVDPLLLHHVAHNGVTCFRPWLVWPIAVVVLVGSFTLVSCVKSKVLRLADVIGTLLIAYIVSLPVFPYEVPHSGIVGIGGIWIGITFGWLLVRDFLFYDESIASPEAGMDNNGWTIFLEQQLDFSKLLFLGLLAAYFGLLVAWFHEIHEFNQRIDSDARERNVLDNLFLVQATVVSLFFLVGPVFEVARQRRKLLKKCLEAPAAQSAA